MTVRVALIIAAGLWIFPGAIADRAHGQISDGASSLMSPQEAFDYIVNKAKDWEDHNKLEGRDDPRSPNFQRPGVYTSAVMSRLNEATESVAQEAEPVGLANLLVIHQSLAHVSGAMSELGQIVRGAVASAIPHVLQDSDLDTLLQAIPNDFGLTGYLAGRPAWMNNPKVISFLADEMDRVTGHAASDQNAMSQVAQQINFPDDMEQGSSSESDNRGGRFTSDAHNELMALLDIAMKSGNTTLLAKTDSILEDAATSENGPDLQELRDMANYCFTNDRPEFLPGLIKAGASVPRSGMMYQDTWAIFAYAIYNGLIGKPAWTAISEIHDAVLQLAEPMIHDEKDGSLATCLKAMVGDPEAFKRSITNYCHHKADLATATQAGLIDYDIQGAEDLFKSIDYHGPPDELKAVNDNIDLCQFDTTKGRWTLTVPGNP